jgi:thiol-disulfide isomerase/thioredoxin
MSFLKRSAPASILVFCAALAPAYSPATSEAAPVRLRGVDLQGGAFDLSESRGKHVLIHFFATWCPACSKELPVIEAFAKAHPSGDLQVLLLTPEGMRTERAVKKWAEKHPFRAALLERMEENSLGAPEALPETILLDGAGTVRRDFKPGGPELSQKSLEESW